MCVCGLGGHLEILQWLRSHNAYWDYTTCLLASRGGHLEILKWASTNGCPYDGHIYLEAASNGHWEILKELVGAAMGGHYENGTPLGDVVYPVFGRNYSEMLK